MSLKPEIAAMHAETYFKQLRTRGLLLEDVVMIFKEAFEELMQEQAELDSYEESDEAEEAQ